MKVEATEVDGRKVYSVRAFNTGLASWLNRLPTIAIREGHRVKVCLTSDIELPVYGPPGLPTPF